MRFLTYSYDACGLGHLRRTFVISRFLIKARPDSSVLSIVGSTHASNYFQPESPNHDYVKLPSVKKVGPEMYEARHLPIEFEGLIALRHEILNSAVRSFSPDVMIVDKNPIGLGGELVSTLETLKAENPSAMVVLSMRDILDDPQVVKREWDRPGLARWIEKVYDAIWIWGDPDIYDPVETYGFPEPIRAMTRFLGYIPPDPARADFRTIRRKAGVVSDKQRLLLMTAGGGGDALPVFRHAIEGLLQIDDPRLRVLLVSGPLMSEDDFYRLKQATQPLRRSLKLVRFLQNFDDWLRAADAVICMGGYNTLSEIAALGKPTLVFPRTFPRREQQIRALEFEKRGWCRTVDPMNSSREVVADFCISMLEDRLTPSIQTLPCRAQEFLSREIQTLGVERRAQAL